jgi:hypothetical protein
VTNYSNQKTKGEAPDIYKLQDALLQATRKTSGTE